MIIDNADMLAKVLMDRLSNVAEYITDSSHDIVQIAEIYDKWKLFKFLETNYDCKKFRPTQCNRSMCITHITLKTA